MQSLHFFPPAFLLLWYYTKVNEHLMRVSRRFKGKKMKWGRQWCLLNLNKLPVYSEEDKRLSTAEEQLRKGMEKVIEFYIMGFFTWQCEYYWISPITIKITQKQNSVKACYETLTISMEVSATKTAHRNVSEKEYSGIFFSIELNYGVMWILIRAYRKKWKWELQKMSMQKGKDFTVTAGTVNIKRWNICIIGNVLHTISLFNRLSLATSPQSLAYQVFFGRGDIFTWNMISYCFTDCRWELKVSRFKLLNVGLKTAFVWLQKIALKWYCITSPSFRTFLSSPQPKFISVPCTLFI